jgi:radical SAM superfamily enzyme YgiQ (UPF0313 family)
MADIVLTTLNSKYQHTAFGLRYLYANLGELQPRAEILEFTTQQNPRDIAERLLVDQPRIISFSVYIWNTRQTYEVVSIIKRLRPETILVLGGPEVSYETEQQAICRLADYTIKGEGDFLFRELCEDLLLRLERPASKWISGPLPEIQKIVSPYSYYSDEDIKNRIIYVEASRGCPYKCEYCLSSLDKQVRGFELDAFLSDLDRLIQRGSRQFKFLDRTFNLSVSICIRILEFFLERMNLGLFIHFEMVPDRLPVELRELIRRFPPGALQFEIGIQTWNPEVSKLVSRRQDYAKIRENFHFLTRETGVHLHADLIVGLPGETLESFGQGFDSLLQLAPHEIQVGILKRLRGTPICRHDQEWEMVYQEESPYVVLQTKTMDFTTIQKLVRYAKFWDLIGNSGNFGKTLDYLKSLAAKRADGSFFGLFLEFTEFLSRRHPQGNGIALLNLLESIWLYLTGELGVEADFARGLLIQDYTGTIKRDIPSFLKTPSLAPPAILKAGARDKSQTTHTPARQLRHLGLKTD